MKKKLITAFLLSLTCACLCSAVACKKGNSNENSSSTDSSVVDSSSDIQTSTYTVTIQGGEGYSVVADGITFNASQNTYTATVEEDNVFTFGLEFGAFYSDAEKISTLSVDGVALGKNADGKYSIPVSKNVTVKVEGVRKDVSAMKGDGSFEDAFVVSRPIDLIHIAEQVNSGNTKYSQGYYMLANDIDCKGEELQVIGDMRNEDAFFSGCFSCLSDGSTMQRFAISNFTINAEKTGHVGLFGAVQADMSIVSSGLFYGIRIDNFSINVNATALPVGERSVYCGGLIGYGMGVRALLCDATNGEITVTSDSNEFSFVGGLIGIAQGAYNSSYNHIALSEIAYANVDVDINVLQGSALAVGGIAGYTLTNSFIAPSFIHNSYATGDVSGAIRAGGLVGIMGQYSSASTSYASGDVVANARNTSSVDGMNPDYCTAYAGGLVGYAENDTVVNDSFSTGTLTAVAVDGANAQKTARNTAGMDNAGKASVNSQKHEILNCPESVDTSALLNMLTQELQWKTENWNLQNTVLPTINYEASESITTTITVNYVTQDETGVKKVKVNQQEFDSCQYIDSYAPFVDALNEGMLSQYLRSDDKTLLSYGYFFDEACTKPVPYSYVTTRDVELYIGFADPSPILGEYRVAVEGKTNPITVSINANREAIIRDGASFTTSPYYYDGKTLTVEGARLARFFNGAIDIEQTVNKDAVFDLNRYMLYYFQAEKTDNALTLYDGVYYTKDAPLYAYRPNQTLQSGAYYRVDGANVYNYDLYPDGTGVVTGGTIGYATFRYTTSENNVTVMTENETFTFPVAELTAYDVFRGEWKRSASVNDFFSFDGKGNWSSFTRVYTRKSYTDAILQSKANELLGTYEISPDGTQLILSLAGNPYANVKFNAEGILTVTHSNNNQATYSKGDAQTGLWESVDGTSLTLHGFDKDGLGKADLHYKFQVNGYSYTADHTLLYERSETENYYCLYLDEIPFGYFYLEPYYNALIATLLNPIGDGSYSTYVFSLSHEIGGEWIGYGFEDLQFSGIGTFNENGDWTSTFKVDGKEYPYTLTKSTLSGTLNYNGQQYIITYDPIEYKLTLSPTTDNDSTITLQRKDKLAGINFVDKNDTSVSVVFDGKGELQNGGTMTVKGTDKYNYKYVSEGNYAVYNGSTPVGEIRYNTETASYTLDINAKTYQLYVANDYMGDWAISGAFDVLKIYPSDLNGNIPATFKGQQVMMTYYDASTLTFSCRIDHMPVTYYLFLIMDEHSQFETFALSEYSSSVYGDFTFCERVDDMFGTWVSNSNPNMTMTFDGVDNNYTYGIVNLTYKLGSLPATSTPYYYKAQDNGEIFVWSQTSIGENWYYYKLVPCAVTVEGAYVLGDKAYQRIAVDALFNAKAVEEKTGYEFLFNGMNTDDEHLGQITATKDGAPTITYSYDIVSYNTNNTVTLTLVDLATNKEYTATLYRSSTPQKIVLVENTTQPQD